MSKRAFHQKFWNINQNCPWHCFTNMVTITKISAKLCQNTVVQKKCVLLQALFLLQDVNQDTEIINYITSLQFSCYFTVHLF